MSMHWMDKLWSWDHCFNALALAHGETDAAVDQFLAPFDHQDATGALPDSITHSEVLYNYVKPPIHGWALRGLRARADRPLTTAELTEIHGRLATLDRVLARPPARARPPAAVLPARQRQRLGQLDDVRRRPGHRVAGPRGRSSSLQLEVLADLADELGLPGRRAGGPPATCSCDALLRDLWNGEGVRRGRCALRARPSTATSLLNLLPLVLGERLPADVRDALAARLEGHLTDFGPATEPVDSPHYEDDGYWRGPIWAPSTALIESGLRASGYAGLADTVSARFRALCERPGFAENFDARTGAGLRDRAYTWTAAVYLTFAADAVARG